jgi:hypothetical protein
MSAEANKAEKLAAALRQRTVSAQLADGRYLAHHVVVARGAFRRFLGLMGRRDVGADEGLWLVPCRSIHMFFMRTAIDVAFLDRGGVVVRTAAKMRPWSLRPLSVTLLPVARAHSALELAPGTLQSLGVVAGSQLTFEPEAVQVASPGPAWTAPASSISSSGE